MRIWLKWIWELRQNFFLVFYHIIQMSECDLRDSLWEISTWTGEFAPLSPAIPLYFKHQQLLGDRMNVWCGSSSSYKTINSFSTQMFRNSLVSLWALQTHTFIELEEEVLISCWNQTVTAAKTQYFSKLLGTLYFLPQGLYWRKSVQLSPSCSENVSL